MNYASIKQFDISNGQGIRVSLFVSGCTHACEGCFNYDAWDFNYGNQFTNEQIDNIIQYLQPNYIKGLSLLGGEPLEDQNINGCLSLVKKLKEVYPNKDVWCYSGYTFDELLNRNNLELIDLLNYIDVLVDGKFELKNKDIQLKFRGSKNQRIIDVKKSMKLNQAILLDGYN